MRAKQRSQRELDLAQQLIEPLFGQARLESFLQVVAENRARAHELAGLFDRQLVEIQRLSALFLGQ